MAAHARVPPAVLETSFWTAAYRAEVVANTLDYFAVIVPGAVEDEIRHGVPGHPAREFPYTTLFRHLRDKMLDPPADRPAPLSLFGRGEAAAIALAGQSGAWLLVNERRALDYATRLGIRTFHVPAMIVTLRARDVISQRAAHRKLDLIAPITAAAIIDEARSMVETL